MTKPSETPAIEIVLLDPNLTRQSGDGEAPAVLKGVLIHQHPEAQKELADRAHDLGNALRSLRIAVNALKSGYRFEDERAPQKIAALDKAVSALEKETALLLQIFSAK